MSRLRAVRVSSLNESPSQKEGKFRHIGGPVTEPGETSMKALPRRKGNAALLLQLVQHEACLNESPSKKEGK